jgi:hypothetical protein
VVGMSAYWIPKRHLSDAIRQRYIGMGFEHLARYPKEMPIALGNIDPNCKCIKVLNSQADQGPGVPMTGPSFERRGFFLKRTKHSRRILLSQHESVGRGLE